METETKRKAAYSKEKFITSRLAGLHHAGFYNLFLAQLERK